MSRRYWSKDPDGLDLSKARSFPSTDVGHNHPRRRLPGLQCCCGFTKWRKGESQYRVYLKEGQASTHFHITKCLWTTGWSLCPPAAPIFHGRRRVLKAQAVAVAGTYEMARRAALIAGSAAQWSTRAPDHRSQASRQRETDPPRPILLVARHRGDDALFAHRLAHAGGQAELLEQRRQPRACLGRCEPSPVASAASATRPRPTASPCGSRYSVACSSA